MSTTKCKNRDRCNMCQNGTYARCSHYEPARKFKAFGWEVTVEFNDMHQETFHWRGCTAGSARTKGLMKRLARRVVEVKPVTEEVWVRAFGIGRM